MKIIHLTDPHLVKKGELLYGLDPHERLIQAIESINSNHSDASFCVITGDLAHIADPKAYKALNQALEQLKIPFHLVMGNHDSREVIQKHIPDFPMDENGFMQTLFVENNRVFIILDSVQAGTHEGSFCAMRRDWLKSKLERFKGRQVYLFMHHPPFKVFLKSMDRIGITSEDEQALTEMLGQYNVRHIFFGHLHRPVHGTWRGIGFSTLRATNHQVWLDFAADESIPGSKEPPAYAVAFIEDNSVVVHNHDFLDSSEKFDMGSSDWDKWRIENEVA